MSVWIDGVSACPEDKTTNNGRALSQAVSAGLSQRRHGLDPRPAHVGFVVDRVTLGPGFPCRIIPPVLRICNFFSYHRRYII
jgi:hypothetical protein